MYFDKHDKYYNDVDFNAVNFKITVSTPDGFPVDEDKRKVIASVLVSSSPFVHIDSSFSKTNVCGYTDTGHMEWVMKKVSLTFPDVLFSLFVAGSDVEQMRVEYFLNGDMCECADCIVLPEFDFDKLCTMKLLTEPLFKTREKYGVGIRWNVHIKGLNVPMDECEYEVVDSVIHARTELSTQNGTAVNGYTLDIHKSTRKTKIINAIQEVSELMPDVLFTAMERREKVFDCLSVYYFSGGLCQYIENCLSYPCPAFADQSEWDAENMRLRDCAD